MQRPSFPIAGSIIFAGGLALGLAALGGNINLPEQNIGSSAPFQSGAATHETWADSQTVFQFPNANEIAPEIEVLSSAPATRSSFMATWENITGATGYLLDVSTSDSFIDYVEGYHDLDVGNVIGRVVTGLNSGTTYYYRVHPYSATGPGSYSEATTATTVPTTGLIIHATFDSSITGNPNAAAIEAMINRAISIYESLFSDPITIQIRFRYATTAPSGTPLPARLLSLSSFVYYTIPWNTAVNAIRADATTNNDTVANASLPGSALSANVLPSSANGRAVGGNTPPAMFANGTVGPGGPYDGIVTLNSARPFKFTRPPSASNFDAQRATEHEIDEVMGFGSRLGHSLNDLRPQDVFSWSSPGHRNITTSGTRYFSINGGVTNLVNFNQNPNGDFGDWLSTACPQAHPYVQNAFGCAGQYSDVTPTSPEGINLDVIGYDLVNAVVTTNTASYITSSSATLNGTVNPNGLTTTVHFEYGTTTSYGHTTPSHSYTGNTTQSVSANITGLSPNTTYRFRLVGTNNGGTKYGGDRTFTTLTATGPPVVITNPATNVASFSATLNGSLDPHGLTTTVYFQYGTTTSYGSTTASQTKSGNTYQSIIANISALTARATYHFRIVASNSGGTTYGSDRTFTTPAACSWITRAPVPYNARGIFAVSDGTYVYAGGGHDGTIAHADLVRYDPGTNTWASLAPSVDQHYLSQAVYNSGKIYNMGGFNGAGVPNNVTRIYNIATNTWTTGAPMPAPLGDQGTVLWNGKIYMVGGYNGSALVNTLYAYNIAANTWSTLAPLPQALALPGFGAINGKLYLASGTNGTIELNTLYIYDIASNTWTTGANVPTAVNGPGSTVFCGKLYLYGGGYPTARNITQIYDPVSNSWSSGPNLNVARRWFYGSAVDTTSIVAPGGNTTTSPVNANEQLAGCPCP